VVMAGDPDHDRSRFVRPVKLTTVRTRARDVAEYPAVVHSDLQPRDEMLAGAITCRYGRVENAATPTFGVASMCASEAFIHH
jgi:hypothetical protein